MSDHPRPTRFSRLLARCYPRELRDGYADDIAKFIDDQRRDRGLGPRPFRGVVIAARLIADALASLAAAAVRRPPRPVRLVAPHRPSTLPRDPLMSILRHDIRFALRGFVRRPGFTLVALATLVLGIGANTAIFTLVDVVLLRPLPYEHPERLAMIWGTNGPQRQLLMTIPDVEAMRVRTRAFSDIAMVRTQSVNLTGGEHPDRVLGAFISPNALTILGAHTAIGRLFSPEEAAIGHGQPVTVLSYPSWQTRFGGDSAVLGTTLILNGRPHVVIGVTAADYFEANPPELWLPITSAPNPAWFERPTTSVWAIGRLRPGLTAADGQRDLQSVAAALAREFPASNATTGVSVLDLRENIVGNSRFMLLVLFGAVGAVLLIVCVNIANLQLARATTRRREMSVRAALGAGRGQLVRQLLTESLLLSLAGGALGLLFGRWVLRVTASMLPGGLPFNAPLTLDMRVALFSLAIAVITGLLFGAPAALYGTRDGLQNALRARTGDAAGRGIDFRSVLVAAELALCIVLLAAAGLFTRSLASLRHIEPGFNAAHVLTAEFRLPSVKYDDSAKVVTFMASALERLRAIPGVQSAALVDAVPLSGNFGTTNYVGEGQGEPAAGTAPTTGISAVSDGYFRTLGIPLLAGRDFSALDAPGTERVVVVNRQFAALVWPGREAVGRTVRLIGPPDQTVRVIGVVGSVKQFTLTEPDGPQMYTAKLQSSGIFSSVALRTSGDPDAMGKALREAIWSVDRDQPVWKVRSLESLVGRDLSPATFAVALIGTFALVALLLAVIGVYGVMSVAVTERHRELGIRMALGARSGQVVALIVRRGMTIVLIATVIGFGGALAAGRLLEARLYGVGAADPLTLVAVPVLLGSAALLACWLPARRAARVDPAITLRSD